MRLVLSLRIRPLVYIREVQAAMVVAAGNGLHWLLNVAHPLVGIARIANVVYAPLIDGAKPILPQRL